MRLLFHAPNVHTGGGLRLLQAVLSRRPSPISWAQLDSRARAALPTDVLPVTCFVKNSLASRFAAEWRLYLTAGSDDVVVCFHGLPPLFPLKSRVVVFLQNRLVADSSSLEDYPFAVRARLTLERIWFRFRRQTKIRYLVQTPTMARAVRSLLGADVAVTVIGFASLPVSTGECENPVPLRHHDFVYVASGEPHKNHLRLLEAWRLLAEMGERPSLALTLDEERNSNLCNTIRQSADRYGLAIENLGQLPADAIDLLYRQAGALIYPSTIESFGLPLIEARRAALPVVAAELDYVRDVAEPVETFDPYSALSIARAVMRYRGHSAVPPELSSADDFLADVLK